MLHVVKYTGPFAYIKPWTAVRDEETFSQQFLTPSIVEGIEKKLFPELLERRGEIVKIRRHRLNYAAIDVQQERTRSKGLDKEAVPQRGDKTKKAYSRRPKMSILKRGVLLEPHLYLAFSEESDAERAFAQHICLCRNEDLLLPIERLTFADEEDFDWLIEGVELVFCSAEEGFKVGYNRFRFGEPMYGVLKINGSPVRRYLY